MVSESVAEVYCEFVKGAVAFYVVFEVFIYYGPFLVVVFEDGLEVGEDAHAACGLVQESVLFVDDGEFSLCTDALSLFHLLGVDFSLVWGTWVGI